MNIHRTIRRREAAETRRQSRPSVPPVAIAGKHLQLVVVGETDAPDSPWQGWGRDFALWTTEMAQTHGLPPHHRDAAAAHEAGHAVVAMTMGASISRISLLRHETMPEVWGGWCGFDWPPSIKCERVYSLMQPLETTHAAVNQVAGVVGEYCAGYGHPASSLDETYEVLGVCAGVSDVRNIDIHDLFHRIFEDARRRIIKNPNLFRALLRALHDRDELQAADISALVSEHGITQVPVVAAW